MSVLLSPTPQHYAWGGHDYLDNLIGRPVTDEPTAELWLGDHPKGPATLTGGNGTLAEHIGADPARHLGPKTVAQFGERLPYLLKVLDVNRMLSIQVHPDKGTAEAGFAREEARGIARTAPDRNFRDDNHKPELGVAISDFYLLHGFKSPAAIRETLRTVPGWAGLETELDAGGVAGLYEYVMRADPDTLDRLLQPLIQSLEGTDPDRSDPAFWVRRAIAEYSHDGHHDRGMFSIYWFNLVHLRPGEAIFQDAGVPHAYLEGQCIELMANSDNVLRGGLTPKHIDVNELLLNTRFDAVVPERLVPTELAGSPWQTYKTPARDFALDFRLLEAGASLTLTPKPGPTILLLWEGEADLHEPRLALNTRQRAAFIPAGEQVTLKCKTDTVIYRARTSR